MATRQPLASVCSAHQKRMKFFCKNHTLLLCSVCAVKRHRTCEEILTLEEAVEDKRSEGKKLLEIHLRKIKTIESVITERKASIKLLSNNVTEIQNEITSISNRISQLVKTQEKAIMQKLQLIQITETSSLDKDIASLEKQYNSAKTCYDALNASLNGRDVDLIFSVIKEQRLVQDHEGDDGLSKKTFKNVDIKLTLSPEVQTFLKGFKTMGDVILSDEHNGVDKGIHSASFVYTRKANDILKKPALEFSQYQSDTVTDKEKDTSNKRTEQVGHESRRSENLLNLNSDNSTHKTSSTTENLSSVPQPRSAYDDSAMKRRLNALAESYAPNHRPHSAPIQHPSMTVTEITLNEYSYNIQNVDEIPCREKVTKGATQSMDDMNSGTTYVISAAEKDSKAIGSSIPDSSNDVVINHKTTIDAVTSNGIDMSQDEIRGNIGIVIGERVPLLNYTMYTNTDTEMVNTNRGKSNISVPSKPKMDLNRSDSKPQRYVNQRLNGNLSASVESVSSRSPRLARKADPVLTLEPATSLSHPPKQVGRAELTFIPGVQTNHGNSNTLLSLYNENVLGISNKSVINSAFRVPEKIKNDFSMNDQRWVHTASFATTRHGENILLTGLALLPDGRLVIVDIENATLQLYDQNYRSLAHQRFDSRPFDVCVLNVNKVAVSLQNDRSLLIMLVNEETFSPVAELSVLCDLICYGISYDSGYYGVCCGNEVWLMSDEGKSVYRFKDSPTGNPLFKQAEYVTIKASRKSLFITDAILHKVMAFKFDGKKLWEFSQAGIQPAGIKLANEKLYVADRGQQGVFMLDMDGNILSEKVAISVEYPIALCLDSVGTKLLVTQMKDAVCNDMSKSIHVFQKH